MCSSDPERIHNVISFKLKKGKAVRQQLLMELEGNKADSAGITHQRMVIS